MIMKKVKRHWIPHSKGLSNTVVAVRFKDKAKAQMLKDRARYETMHYRIEHDGKGRTISSADIVRRLVDEFFAKVSELPDDPVGAALRATERKP